MQKRSVIFFFYLLLALIYFLKPVLHGNLIATGDAILYFYPLKLYYAREFLKHGIHLWLPYEFLGLPFLGTMQTGILYPLNWIYFFIPTAYAFNLSLIMHYALAAFFMFLYTKKIGIKDFPAFLSGLVFGFSGFLMAHQGTISMLNTAVWIPLLLYFYEKTERPSAISRGVQGLSIRN